METYVLMSRAWQLPGTFFKLFFELLPGPKGGVLFNTAPDLCLGSALICFIAIFTRYKKNPFTKNEYLLGM